MNLQEDIYRIQGVMGIITESRLDNITKEWLNDNFGDLVPLETERHPNIIFYMKNGEVVFEYDKKNGYVDIANKEIWLFLQSMFGMEHKQIENLIEEWAGEHYKLRVRTKPIISPTDFWVDED